ncbi:hypothetical protein ARALYDRAFT_903697 [Arabidopsis lyrata subsp. lyrata]|uniref:Uncharacterized protein n=1 Tax=Arabidopsis lyrata subsp. lyrata TaxID=81972 RepID=D7LJY4_ARALL|nr:hypothetical protein ARALYDRAFT_903697 [Arabidopsis lyrata subsp. lyrata]
MTTLTSCRSDRNLRINCCKQIKSINKDNSWKQRNNMVHNQQSIPILFKLLDREIRNTITAKSREKAILQSYATMDVMNSLHVTS